MKTVNLELVGLDGNAHCLLGAFTKQARKENWSKAEIDGVIKRATSGDYDHLLSVLCEVCVPIDVDNDEDENEDEMRSATPKKVKARFEYLRNEIIAERISMGEIMELQSLAKYITPDDVLLREWAGIQEKAQIS